MPISDRAFERLLGQFVAARNQPPRLDEVWDIAAYPGRGIAHLLVDGWLSSSDADHIAAQHQAFSGQIDPRWVHRIGAFSFRAPGVIYDPRDTDAAVDVSADTLVAHLRGDQHEDAGSARWVVTAYSLGTAVALLALAHLLAADPPALRRMVPQVILLEPAIQGGSAVAAYLTTHPDQDFVLNPSPVLIDLLPANGDIPVRAQRAITDLLDAGIAVTVLASAADEFTSYEPLDDQRIHHIPIPNDVLSPRGAVDPLMVHFRVKRHGWPHARLHYLAKPLVSKRLVELVITGPGG